MQSQFLTHLSVIWLGYACDKLQHSGFCRSVAPSAVQHLTASLIRLQSADLSANHSNSAHTLVAVMGQPLPAGGLKPGERESLVGLGTICQTVWLQAVHLQAQKYCSAQPQSRTLGKEIY